MILVTGAAGKTGQAILKALDQRGATTRALIYRAEHEAVVRAAGAAEVAHGDLRDVDSLTAAARGAGAIYHICPNVSPDEITIGRAVIAAATAASVPRLVYHSVIFPHIEAMPHHWRKLRVEEALLASELDVTILQPTAYMQNLLAHWPRIVEDGVLPVPYSASSRISLVDLDNVAEAAATVLTEDGHAGAIYALSSAAAPDQTELATILGEVLDHTVRAEEISRDDWRRQALASGLDRDRCKTLVAMFRYYDRHGMVGNPTVLRWLLGREPTGLRDFFERCTDLPTRGSHGSHPGLQSAAPSGLEPEDG